MQNRIRPGGVWSRLLSMVLILLFAAAMCILPGNGTGKAVASPGSGWVDQTPVPDGDELLSVTAVDADTAWAVGGTTFFHTTDGGSLWTPQDPSGKYANAIDAADPMHAWAMGGLGETWPDSVLQTWDGGSFWAPVNVYTGPIPLSTMTDVTAQIWDVDVVDTSTVWAAGGGCNVVVRTANGGWTWELKHFDMSAELECLMGISAVDADTVWTVGNMGTVLRTSDGGQTWESLEPLEGYVPYTDVSAVDAETAWIVVGGGVLRTTDGGDTWEVSGPGAPYSFNAIHAVDTYTAWAVGSTRNAPVTPGSFIFKTIDGGETWVSQESGVDSPLRDVFAVDATTAWAVGYAGTILKTTDGGDAGADIAAIVPSAAAAGGQVTLSGCDFGDVQGSSSVSFGEVQATAYASWSDTEIVVEVPAGVIGEVLVTVTTAEGVSNPKALTVLTPPVVTAVAPAEGVQQTLFMGINATGSHFQPGAALRLEMGEKTINAINAVITGDSQIQGTISLFGAEPGVYDVVVHNPDSSEARLEDAFTVNSFCGAGSGTALLMLGLTLGLLSLAGSARLRRRKKR
jgi:photosystem II stability/assembly factor-like uncharacterized protein